MLHHILGETDFKDGLTKFLNDHQYANANADDLWKAMSLKIKESTVKDVMNTWTTQAGFPVVTATKNYESKQVTISQVRHSPL